jgi:hypothetical protein
MNMRLDGCDLGLAMPRGDFPFRGSSHQEQTPHSYGPPSFRNGSPNPSLRIPMMVMGYSDRIVMGVSGT